MAQKNGRWGKAFEVPGTAALNAGRGAETFAVSCKPAGECSAAGYYLDSSARSEVFVVSRT